MMDIKHLYTTETVIKRILRECPDARNSDDLLYLLMIKDINKKVLTMPFAEVIANAAALNVPKFQTVIRVRRKVQNENEDLRPNETVKGYRRENRKVFRDYARDKNEG